MTLSGSVRSTKEGCWPNDNDGQHAEANRIREAMMQFVIINPNAPIHPSRRRDTTANQISSPGPLSLLLLVAFGRIPIQRVFKLSRDRRSFEVAGQNFMIGCVVAVEFPVGFLIRPKRRACQ